MAQSLTKIYIHFVFHVKIGSIKRDHLTELWTYLASIARSEGSFVVKVGGEPDHVHMLCTLPKQLSMPDFAEVVKRGSSRWIKGKGLEYQHFTWQRGYAAFSVSQSKLEDVTRYIDNQFEHHKRHTFREEYLQWLQKYEIDYDSRYVFSD